MSARSKRQKQAESEKVGESPVTISHSRSVVHERSRTSMPSTPQNTSVRGVRSNSPLSISRTEEKDELAHLNDRLAGYIDYVRKLEFDKEHLTRRIQTVTEERMSKVEDARKTYEDEIQALRNLIDDLAKQKSKADLDAKQAKDDASDARLKLSKRDQEVRQLSKRIEALEKELTSFKDSHDRYPSLLSDHHTLEKRFEQVRRDLEGETILRTDLENKVLGLKEQLDFRNRLFDEEREKLIQQKVYIEEEVEGRKQAEYESKLADELRLIREQTAHELDEYKMQIEETFETKLGQLRSSADQSDEDASRHRSEMVMERKRAGELSHDLAKKVAELELLQRRLGELEKLLEQERRDHEIQSDYHRQEVRRLKDQLEESFREFTDLMNTKIALDQEILMYRKMLEGEESRLNLQATERVESPFNVRFGKRRHGETDSEDGLTSQSITKARFAYRVSTTSTGPVEFWKEQDLHGKWVKIHNPSVEDVSIGQWELVHECGGQETRFKFHRSLVVKAGATCVVWSSDSETTHNPPTDVVMKNKAFHPGTEATITLLDADGAEQAKCTVKRERIRASSVAFKRKSTHRNGGADEKCMVM